MACGVHAREIEESTITSMFNERYLRDFPHIGALRQEQKTCLVKLTHGKYVLAILMIATGFGKSLIFQLGPRLERLALPLENKLESLKIIA